VPQSDKTHYWTSGYTRL